MTSLQNHLVTNYKQYYKVLSNKFDSTIAGQGLSALYCTLETSNAAPDNVEAYLMTALVAACIVESKGRSKVTELVEYMDAPWVGINTMEADLTLKQESAKLKAAVLKLSPESKKVIETVLKYDMTVAEVAMAYQYKYEAAKSLWRYGVHQLRKEMV